MSPRETTDVFYLKSSLMTSGITEEYNVNMNSRERIEWSEPLHDYRDGDADALSSRDFEVGPYAMHAMSGPEQPTPDWVVKSWEKAARERLAREAAAGDISTGVES
jgi:hypothetical protein